MRVILFLIPDTCVYNDHTHTGHMHIQTTCTGIHNFNIIFVVMFLLVKVGSMLVLDPHRKQITIKLHVSRFTIGSKLQKVYVSHFYPADFINDPWSSFSYVSTSVEIFNKSM